MKAIIIKDIVGNPLFIAKVEEVGELDFIKIQKECKKNQTEFFENYKRALGELGKKDWELEQDIKYLKGE